MSLGYPILFVLILQLGKAVDELDDLGT